MPRYQFICLKCKREKEVIKPMSKRNDTEKCECGYKMNRLIGLGKTFKLKGEGFYCNREEDK